LKKVTQKDVARRVGVDRSTVSLVLSNHPSIPPVTRDAVLAACRDLGYEPDPFLSQLAAYRSQNRSATYRGVLAWLVNVSSWNNWREIPQYAEYFGGAKERAGDFGYDLEPFELGGAISGKRLVTILKARNVSGLLLCPQPRDTSQINDFPFENFSCVAMGFSLVSPRLHVVTSHQLHAALRCVQNACADGYRRVGFAIPPFHDRRVDHNYIAGYFLGMDQAGFKPLSRFGEDVSKPEKFLRWLATTRADAVLCSHYSFQSMKQAVRTQGKFDPAFYCPSLPSRDSDFPGIYEDSTTLGAKAMDQLVGMIRRGEKGVPLHPVTTLIEGEWHDVC
jgi:LacI family transcriptional regulator/LacI family repressor for deo operon, udp, cdd, tsx, nupC, and nupG